MTVGQKTTDWYRRSSTEVLNELATTTDGLSDAAATARLQQVGANELIEKGAKSPLVMLREQFTNVMVLILIAAAVLSLLLGKLFEAGAVLAIVVLFAVLGFLQEYRAERAIASLKKLAVPQVRVRRNGRLIEIASRELVPGDVISLEAGNLVPADVRVLESINLRVQEAALTGESEPVEKHSAPLDQELPLGDRRNIADLLQAVRHDPTPLQQRLDAVGKQLAIAGVVVAALIFAIGTLLGEGLADMLLTAVSVAVAVIPEGLPAVVTFTLALGAQRMLRRNALIRKLPAVETLGSVTTICSDKTGTLTENRMTVTTVVLPGRRVDLSRRLAEVGPRLTPGLPLPELRAGDPQGFSLLLSAAALCNDAVLRIDTAGGNAEMLGDPTEGALLVAAARGGWLRADLDSTLPRVAELPFDSERKRMTTVHARPQQGAPHDLAAAWRSDGYAAELPYLALSKGAVDGLLELSTLVWQDGTAQPLTAERRAALLAENDRLARDGMRVLGVAFRPLVTAAATADVEQELIFLGMLGMIDPPRPEVRDAVARCRAAGIRPIMITGDHPLTAAAIARDLGISGDGTVITGTQLAAMNDEQLAQEVRRTSVFARVSPEHKLKIVAALQGHGEVVAMTGDGVNDAPALKKADIGVAMGITGTDVSKEAAEMVLRDDNFATIVAAVEEGRVIYDNLRRFVKFAVAGNIGKVLVMLCWPLLFVAAGLPIETAVALLPLQLLWLNLMTDGLLGLSMGVEPAEKQVMQRPPHRPTDGIFAGGMAWQTVWVGIAIGALALGAGFWYYIQGLAQWQSVMFSALAVLQVFQALATRSNRESLFSIGVFSNRGMWAVIGLLVVLQALVLYTPLAGLLGLLPLTAGDLLFCLALGLLLFALIEAEKWVLRGRAAAATLRRA
jgi:Ca2+-transporting ATPase